MEKGDMVYWARIIPQTGTFDVMDLKIRTVKETYFVGVEDKSSQAFPFSPNDIGEVIFSNRADAVMLVKEAQEEYKPNKLTTLSNDNDDNQ